MQQMLSQFNLFYHRTFQQIEEYFSQNEEIISNPQNQKHHVFKRELLNFHLRMGRNLNHKYFDCKNKNKQNAIEYINSKQNFDTKVGITDIFSIKAVSLKNSHSSKMIFPLKFFKDITNNKSIEYAQTIQNQYETLKRRSQTRILRKNQKSKTASDQTKRQSSCQNANRKSRTATQKLNQKNIFKQRRLLLNTNDKVFDLKFQNYCSFLQSVADLHKIKIQFQDYDKMQTIAIGKGNNSKLIKDTLKKRWWLKIQDRKFNQPLNFNQINFLWTQSKVNQFYQNSFMLGKNMHNHFQLNGNLGNKKQLFLNMKSYYIKIGKNPFQHLPLTFHIKNIEQQEFKQFKDYFEQQNNKSTSKCLWIVKPGQNSNRGRGITLHNSIEQIQKLISQQTVSLDSEQKPQSHTFIVQKYIQKPFLYQKRKFDFRCYYLLVSVNDKIKAYWYKQGYIRTSCFQFNCNTQNQNNFYVHLTNDAVQKNSQDYGKFQDGNKIDYNTFRKYLASKNLTKKYDFDADVYPKMKQIALDSVKATYKKLRNAKKQVFEVFGLDFMIDDQFKPWLIEVNTNPCLQTSCLVLQRIIPKMLDDAFQLSLDVIFPPPKTWPQSRKHLVPNHNHNSFELIFDEQQYEKTNVI